MSTSRRKRAVLLFLSAIVSAAVVVTTQSVLFLVPLFLLTAVPLPVMLPIAGQFPLFRRQSVDWSWTFSILAGIVMVVSVGVGRFWKMVFGVRASVPIVVLLHLSFIWGFYVSVVRPGDSPFASSPQFRSISPDFAMIINWYSVWAFGYCSCSGLNCARCHIPHWMCSSDGWSIQVRIRYLKPVILIFGWMDEWIVVLRQKFRYSFFPFCSIVNGDPGFATASGFELEETGYSESNIHHVNFLKLIYKIPKFWSIYQMRVINY